MLRGTTKRVIEVVNTENDYFERIIFIVKGDKTGVSEPELKKQARSYISANGARAKRAAMYKSRMISAVIKTTAASAAAGLVSVIAFILLTRGGI